MLYFLHLPSIRTIQGLRRFLKLVYYQVSVSVHDSPRKLTRIFPVESFKNGASISVRSMGTPKAKLTPPSPRLECIKRNGSAISAFYVNNKDARRVRATALFFKFPQFHNVLS